MSTDKFLAAISKLPSVKTRKEVEIERVEVSLSALKIDMYDDQGRILSPDGENKGPPRSCDFDVSGPGIESWRVRRVILPTLDYASPAPLVAIVKMTVFEDMDEARRVAKEAGWSDPYQRPLTRAREWSRKLNIERE